MKAKYSTGENFRAYTDEQLIATLKSLLNQEFYHWCGEFDVVFVQVIAERFSGRSISLQKKCDKAVAEVQYLRDGQSISTKQWRNILRSLTEFVKVIERRS